MYEWQPIILTLQLAVVTTVILFVISVPIAYWLAFSPKKHPWVEAIILLPLVVPPVVLGFYLLLAFGKSSFLGKLLHSITGLHFVFTFEGLVLASLIYSLPFMVKPLQSGFESIPHRWIETAYCLGKSKWQTLYYVMLPNMKFAILSAIALSFAHTVGEFGVVLMIGGSIPGKTKVASIAIYDAVQSLDYSLANFYALVLVAITFVILLCVYKRS